MNKENLQQLMEAYNALYSMTVTGDSIITMAQVLIALQGVIGEMATELNAASCGEDSETEHMEESIYE